MKVKVEIKHISIFRGEVDIDLKRHKEFGEFLCNGKHMSVISSLLMKNGVDKVDDIWSLPIYEGVE